MRSRFIRLSRASNPSYLPDQQRFDPSQTNSLFANQNYLTAGFPLPILPFTLPVDKNFVYGYAQQANLRWSGSSPEPGR